LAAVLMLTAWNMSEPEKWREHLRLKWAEKALFFLTLILTVLTDLTIAIGVGVAAGLVLRLFDKSKSAKDWTPRER
jgi:SulP family sulfate permease